MQFATPEAAMRHALAAAALGQGRVEPNPMVGAVVLDADGNLVGEGFHERFGGPHAEIVALRQAGPNARGGTLFVTLEPCAHFGKTPPCAPEVVRAGVRRVYVAVADPFPVVAGRGFEILREAGIEVHLGLLEPEGRRLLAPYLKLTTAGIPWVHAKWAMTIDGRIATASGDSQWISSTRSRAIVHELRGRVDAVVVGISTALHDDPLLTARPSGPRTATRIVFDRTARLPVECQLVKSAQAFPLIVATGSEAPSERVSALESAGVEVLRCGDGRSGAGMVRSVLEELGARRMTNVLVEGGGQLLGSFFDAGQVDEAHVFLGPRVIGSAAAPGPVSGRGRDRLAEAATFRLDGVEWLDDDVYLHYRTEAGRTPNV
ncbi:MAG: bifunctional diaminohydroxyphosphoribosylaminopyrimidine deaminase/5-amino-6-(5-phosphoribosylamino)uracil reductase RibD [Planctomyces sp.]|nr:bifunctional diaminohydroxyphosphoribosylaminopyrimidine deaminase/5-amino-6-(5-phosphoribosylamino)uracil reductase RibD [Planctomyces sp.]